MINFLTTPFRWASETATAIENYFGVNDAVEFIKDAASEIAGNEVCEVPDMKDVVADLPVYGSVTMPQPMCALNETRVDMPIDGPVTVTIPQPVRALNETHLMDLPVDSVAQAVVGLDNGMCGLEPSKLETMDALLNKVGVEASTVGYGFAGLITLGTGAMALKGLYNTYQKRQNQPLKKDAAVEQKTEDTTEQATAHAAADHAAANNTVVVNLEAAKQETPVDVLATKVSEAVYNAIQGKAHMINLVLKADAETLNFINRLQGKGLSEFSSMTETQATRCIEIIQRGKGELAPSLVKAYSHDTVLKQDGKLLDAPAQVKNVTDAMKVQANSIATEINKKLALK